MNNPKIKIIYILCHPPNPIIYKYNNPEEFFNYSGEGEFIKLKNYPYWIGFFNKDHHAIAASELQNLTCDFDIECWRIYGDTIKEIYSKNVDRIIHRVFPSFKVKIPQVGSGYFSPALLRFLVDYSSAHELIINISVGHAWFHIWLFYRLRKYKNRIPIVAHQISGGFKKFNYARLNFVKRILKFYYLFENEIDRRSLRLIDHYFVGSKIEADYLNPDASINSSFFTGGIDFELFKPFQNKIKLREELGLPIDKKIMIATGNFRKSDYGYHHLIECYDRIKSKHNDLVLIIIGGYKHEDLYNVGREAGVIMIERTHKEKLLKYFQASDFYGQPSLDYGFITYGGFGFAMMEALACGLPILSQNIIHFPGPLAERNKIGLDMPTKEDLIKNMIYLKDNYQKYTECRSIAQKYFDIKDTKMVLLNKYRELAAQYFGNNSK